MYRVLMLALLGVGLSSCVAPRIAPLHERTQIFETHFDAMFETVAAMLEYEGYVLRAVEPWNGYIDTRPRVEEHGYWQSRISATLTRHDNNATEVQLRYLREDISHYRTSELICPEPEFGRENYDCYYETLSMVAPGKVVGQEVYDDLFLALEDHLYQAGYLQ